MRRLLFVLIFVFAFAGFTFGQAVIADPAFPGLMASKISGDYNIFNFSSVKTGTNKSISPYNAYFLNGFETVIKIKWLGIIPVPVIETVPVYKTVSFTEPGVRFPADLPVGFIVGTNNSVKDLLPSAAKTTASVLEASFATAEVFHIVHSAALIGLLTGSPGYAKQANKAKQMVSDIDGMVNHVTRSYDGDGLVARGNQYYPRTVKDPVGKEKNY